MSPQIKASIFTIFFSIFGIGMIWKNANYATLPLFVFYVVLLVNTFFSIRFFSRIIPAGRHEQKAVDCLLVILYAVLTLNLGYDGNFWWVATLLFTVAVVKYVLLYGKLDARILLKKIVIDSTGVAVCFLAVVGVLSGRGAVTNWVWAIVFLVANVYLLAIKPMYK